MVIITLIYALILIVLGVVGYTGGSGGSMTALIPAFFGAGIAICGLVAAKPGLRKHAMHGAAALALIAMLMHLAVFILRITGKMGDKANMMDLGPQMMMLTAVASSVFLAFAVRSFVQARRSRA